MFIDVRIRHFDEVNHNTSEEEVGSSSAAPVLNNLCNGSNIGACFGLQLRKMDMKLNQV